jgi:formate/nitrite transporter FocA (FNT family)
MFLGAKVSTGQWWMWNQIPVTLGNIVAGGLFTGIALWYTHARKLERAVRSTETQATPMVAKAG